MGRKGIEISGDYSADELKRLAGQSRDAGYVRRLLMIAAILEGAERQEAAKIGNIGAQTLRDWVIKYNAQGADGLLGKQRPGRQPTLDTAELRKFRVLVEADPDLYKDGVVRWRLKDLQGVIWQFFRKKVCEMTVSRYLKQLGFSHMSARPLHPKQKKGAVEAFKKKFKNILKQTVAHLPAGIAVEIWFQDEARIGQKNKLVRQWAKKGSRPRQPSDQRYKSVYIFGAVCPARDIGVAWIEPKCNTAAMQVQVDEIGKAINPGAHGVVLTDGAGWHKTAKLKLPDNISLIILPPYCPELNPAENIWQFLRQNYLSAQVYETTEEIVEACCNAWNSLIAETGRITSIASREWLI